MTHSIPWLRATALSLLLLLTGASTASAASTGYGAVQGVSAGGGGGDPAGTTDPSGQLPFTGLDLGPLLVVGLALILLGLALARSGRATDR